MTTKPVILAVDDEPTLLSAIECDVGREYGADFQMVCTTSGSEALATLKQLKLRNEAGGVGRQGGSDERAAGA